MSVDLPMGPIWILCVDTDRYAGNFERQLVAYCTGHYGDCGVGREEAKEFHDEVEGYPFEGFVVPIADEHGCDRPASIWSTPGWRNNGYGVCKRTAEIEALSAEAAAQWKKSWPAYMSVAAFFVKRPTPELVALFTQRVEKYIATRGYGFRKTAEEDSIRIEGYRLLVFRGAIEEESLDA